MTVTDSPTSIPADPRLTAGCPTGPIEGRWDRHKFDMKLVNPGNKRKFEIIVVGTGLAGASAAASLAQLGYKVKAFTFHDSPRRAHSIAAQGGINAAKNYPNDGDSVYRLFYDTVKGGDFRARESNVYRLAEVSVNIIDQCVAQGVPFARDYGGLLDNRSFGGAQVSRTFYARGQTGQQLLLGRLPGPRAAGLAGQRPPVHQDRDARRRGGRREGGRHRRARPGHRPDQLALGPRGRAGHRRVRQHLLPVHQRHELQRHRHLAGAQARRHVRQPLLHPDPPDLHPLQRRVPVEADPDVGVAAQRRPHLGAQGPRRPALARPDPRGRPRLLPRAQVPGLRQPRAPRRGLTQRQDHGRHRLRRRPAEELGVPRLRRCHPAPGRERHPRAIREPVRHVRAHHRREPLPGPDAHLPGHPLHDGRACGSTTT